MIVAAAGTGNRQKSGHCPATARTVSAVSGGDEDEGFRVVASAEDGVVTVRAEGDFDLAAAPVWETTVPTVLSASPHQIDVDLGGVSFMDSSGLGLLVKLRQTAETDGMRLRLLNVPHRVARVLDYSGVTTLFEISAAELEPD